VPCWIAPRNVRPGKPYDDEIAFAIETCRAMLLIFSERCNTSEYIRREVTVAGDAGKVIMPFRIEDARPTGGLRVRLSDLHWVDAFVRRERAIDEVISALQLEESARPMQPQRHRAGAEAREAVESPRPEKQAPQRSDAPGKSEKIASDPIESNQAPYFAVSLLKLIVMSICTFGIYELYWFYKNWKLIKDREGIDIAPFWRAFFAVFFCYQCFSRIRATAASLGLHQSLYAGPLAAGWIITNLLWKLPDQYWLISMLSFLFILPAQTLANRVNATAAPHHDPNRRFTAWNLAGVAAGGILLILAIIGTFMSD
jgi:hypothetical protein